MLDSRVIGSYISKLRKEADLTQGELADRLNVTHQAVSKWERGESIPDIGTLMAVAKEFNKSVDQLLYGGKNRTHGNPIDPLVEKIAEREPEAAGDLVNSGEVTIDELVNVAPLIKTSVLQKVTQTIDGTQFTLDHLTAIAPFLDEKTLEELLSSVKDVEIDWETISSLAPFISSDMLNSFINGVSSEKPNIKEVVDLAPFLGKHTDRFANEIVRGQGTWDDVVSLAPFVSHNTLKKLIDETLEASPKIKELAEVAPFLHEYTDQLVQQALENDDNLSWDEIEELAPFIKSGTIVNLIDRVKDGKTISFHQYVELAPFLREHINELLLNAPKDNLSWSDIESVAPFVKRSTLTVLIDQVVDKPTSAEQIAGLAPFLESEKLSELIAAIPAEQLDPEMLTELAPFLKKPMLTTLFTKLFKKA